MWTIKGKILCTISDINRIKKRRNHCQFGDPFAVTLHYSSSFYTCIKNESKNKWLKNRLTYSCEKETGRIKAIEDSLYTGGLNDAQMLSTKSKSKLHITPLHLNT